MWNLILDVVFLSALLLFAVSLENFSPSAALSRDRPDTASVVSRYLLVAFAGAPWVVFDRLRSAERALQRVGAKLLAYAGAFTGRPYLSEILLSAFISVAFVGWLAARRLASRLVCRTRPADRTSIAALLPATGAASAPDDAGGQAA
jgi:hypothetical protein